MVQGQEWGGKASQIQILWEIIWARTERYAHAYPLQITADFKVGGDGSVEFKEKDGIDYAPITVQLPRGERVPFLFTIKQLDAKGTLDSFSGDFTVPSYRGSSFLDPKVREWMDGQVDVSGSMKWGGMWIWEPQVLKALHETRPQVANLALHISLLVSPSSGSRWFHRL